MKNRVSEYSRTTVLLLAFFFGLLAAHRFFVGYKRSAMAQLIFTLVTGGTAIVFSVNHPFLLWGDFSEPVLVSTVLTDYRTLLGLLFPLVVVQLWVWFDIISLVLGYFKDSDGRTVKFWTIRHVKY